MVIAVTLWLPAEVVGGVVKPGCSEHDSYKNLRPWTGCKGFPRLLCGKMLNILCKLYNGAERLGFPCVSQLVTTLDLDCH